MNRQAMLERVNRERHWDVIVIGGGASGLGAALDATTRGFKTLLLESHDFAKATSSRSTKLVHGGVRYLAQGQIDLVFEALRERGLLAKNAAHLVNNQSFVIPNYRWWEGYYYQIGLTIYDWMARKWRLGKTQRINKNNTLQKLPTLNPNKLYSSIVYHDGQFDDARLAVNLAQSIVEHDGCALNYMKVVNLRYDAQGRVNGVVAEDQIAGHSYELTSQAVINATGVFTNSIIAMDQPNSRDYVVPSQGIHLVFDRAFLPGEDALMIPKTSDGRVLFAIPWHDKIVVGTTDTLVDKAQWEPKPLAEEVDFILSNMGQYLSKKPSKDDVLSVFAGLRPLAAPKDKSKSTKEVSRSHKVWVSKSGLVTIAGGKWTTYRKMAEDTINQAIKVTALDNKPCQTEHLSIHGNTQNHDDSVLAIYGSDKAAIHALAEEHPPYAQRIHADYPYLIAQVIWAVREEMAMTVEDVLARRLRLLFLDARAAIACAHKVATVMADELGHNAQWIEQQTSEFITLAQGYLLADDKHTSTG
ncbi:glycerol-3-phosphate dehydrogenase/oxidase [Suttonella sp. R2A3]|uniref:glycerol-3-phosphate dehydrogenase/oxidase n=1 Tax=Suttonella sp. R2A3 TaxID=2908648 RepID=UPI001F40046A|nr:glycerol-3-phosphate dehydrogenase/oxidase [Suttonella sp. R2A3]UJF24461.1 glycerol-3-phosphate dehydrogenase/oxidase [Suttonella sp. R2A3]